ncbi:MAG TPA: PAS domain-containing protein [Thermoleophilia bacterium]|nr:PAS domain-containing protein [Thermoleophilia bacterium]
MRVNFDALYDWDVRTGFVDFTERLDALLGYPPGGFPRSFDGWLAEIHPDDRLAVAESVERSVATASTFREEYRLRKADGEYLLIRDNSVVVALGGGTPSHMLGAMRNVTHEREHERALQEAGELHRFLLANIVNPILVTDGEGRVIEANPAAQAFFESEESGLVGCGLDEFMPPEVVRLTRGAASSSSESELAVDFEIGERLKTLLITVVAGAVGAHNAFVFGTDITVRKRMQEELERSHDLLRAQAKALDERNTALRVVLEQRAQDRKELEQRIMVNIDRLIYPTLDRLERVLGGRPEALDVESLQGNLREIVGPFAGTLASESHDRPLTRREYEIADLVRLGKTTDEIAEALHVSRSVVSFHRSNIRKKLGLRPGGPRLTTHLAALSRR